MKYITVVIASVLLLLSCTMHHNNSNTTQTPKVVIALQPFDSFPKAYINYLKDSIAHFYHVEVMVLASQKTPANAWYAPKQRWIADSIIAALRTATPLTTRATVGLIVDDISTQKGSIKNYGVMGLGYEGGKACVVSTFRPSRNIKNEQHLLQRLLTVTEHELGHNFGLPHCPNQSCIMVDAEGKMKLDQTKSLCSSCLQKMRI